MKSKYKQSLKRARLQSGLTLEELSAETKMSYSSLKALETGKRFASTDTKEKLNSFFEMELDYIKPVLHRMIQVATNKTVFKNDINSETDTRMAKELANYINSAPVEQRIEKIELIRAFLSKYKKHLGNKNQ